MKHIKQNVVMTEHGAMLFESDVIRIIEELEKPKWIPCGEQLPENDGVYI